MSEYLLALQDVSKSFSGVPALKPCDLTLRAGEILGLVGENGEFDAASPGGRFSRHFARARAANHSLVSLADARQRIEEARLFIDAAHAYDATRHPQGIPPAAAQPAVKQTSSGPTP